MAFTYIHEANGPLDIISIKGRLIAASDAEDLKQKILDLVSNNRIKVLVNLSELDYMNSTGLNVLLGLFTTIRNVGGEMIMGGTSKKVKDLLAITKLNSVFNIYDNMDEARVALLK